MIPLTQLSKSYGTQHAVQAIDLEIPTGQRVGLLGPNGADDRHVGTDGKVKEVIILDGQPTLNAAAITSARPAVFRPALQGHRPVEVWVVMPITFRLRN